MLVTVVLFWNILANPSLEMVGHAHSEQNIGAWANYAAQRTIWEDHAFPGWVPGVANSEKGGVIFPVSLPTTLLSLPLYPLLNVVGSYNLSMALNMVLAFIGAFLFFRHLTGSGASLAALPGALLFVLSPYCLESFAYGPVECTALAWIPLALLGVERLGGGQLRHHLARAGVLALCGWSNPYYGIFTALAATYLMLSRGNLTWRRRLGRTALTMGLLGVLMLPMAWALQASITHPDSLIPRRATRPAEVLHDNYQRNLMVLDVAGLAIPTRDFNTMVVRKGYYLGISGLVLCVLAAVRRRRSRRWLWLGLGALLFSVGGGLRVGGHLLSIGNVPIPMPAYYLCKYVPPFTEVLYPMRALPLVALSMGAMITLLIARLAAGWKRRGAVAATCLVLAVDLVGIFQPAPHLPTHTVRIPQFFMLAQEDPEPYGVVDLPLPVTDEEIGNYLLYQQYHRKRMPYNLDMRPFPGNNDPKIKAFFTGLWMPPTEPNSPRDWTASASGFKCNLDCDGRAAMASQGYRYLVLHLSGNEYMDTKLIDCVERCFSERQYTDDQIIAYWLPAAGLW